MADFAEGCAVSVAHAVIAVPTSLKERTCANVCSCLLTVRIAILLILSVKGACYLSKLTFVEVANLCFYGRLTMQE